VETTDGTQLAAVQAFVDGLGMTASTSTSPQSVKFNVPLTYLGTMRITPITESASTVVLQPLCWAAPVEVTIATTAALQSLNVIPLRFDGALTLRPGQTRSMQVEGTFAGIGTDNFPLQDASRGTSYASQSGTAAIVTVSATGDVTGVAPGTDAVVITNRGLTVTVPVTVDGAAQPTPTPTPTPTVTPTPTPVAASLSFQCYKASVAKAPKGQPQYSQFVARTGDVAIDTLSSSAPDDQHKLDLKKVSRVCSAANTSGSAAPPNAAHLNGYQAAISKTNPKQPVFESVTRTFVNSFGSLTLKLSGVEGVMIPSSHTAGDAGAPPLGSSSSTFKCYKAAVAKAPKGEPAFPEFVPATTTIVDFFGGPLLYQLKKPTRVCFPANFNGQNPAAVAETKHLLCYQTALVKTKPAQPKFSKTLLSTRNLFGAEVLTANSVQELCVSSTVVVP